MKKQLSRCCRCFVLTAFLLVSCVSATFATNLFETPYDIKWNDSSGGYIYYDWYMINIPVSGHPITPARIDAGTNYWVRDIVSDATGSRGIQESQISAANAPVSGFIVHSIPSEEWWESHNAYFQGNALAFAIPVDTAGRELNYSYQGTLRIDYGAIFYNPDTSYYTGNPYASNTVVAHELGHLFGFGHEEEDSIMRLENSAMDGIEDLDIENYKIKYN